MQPTRFSPWAAILSAAILAGCGGEVSVLVSPGEAELEFGERRTFTVKVSGAEDTAVVWSIREGSAGGVITPDGVFTAGQTEGTFHVVATLEADDSHAGSARVTVKKPVRTVAITLRPANPQVEVGQTLPFFAEVTGTDDTAVTWSVVEGDEGGIITEDGRYTAPGAPGSYHVRAVSRADPSKSAVAVVSVHLPTSVQLTIHPGAVTLERGGTQRFTATVTQTVNTDVLWSVQQNGGGTITANGLYTAPSEPGTYQVIARSAAYPDRQATATVTVIPPPPPIAVSISPESTTVELGRTQAFTATVTGTSLSGVTWRVLEGDVGGTISAEGLYSPPSEPGVFHVVVTSVVDPSKSATAVVTVIPAPVVEVAVSPATVLLVGGASHTFSATVTGVPNLQVTWSVLEGAAGGTIDANGEYTSPTTPGVYHVVATSDADPSVSATAEVTVSLPAPIQAGLEASFAADKLLGDGVALPANGTEVSNWLDLTSNARNLSQTNASRRPSFVASSINGRPSIAFDGVDDHLLTALFAQPLQPTTVLIVYRSPPSGARANLIDAPAGTTHRNRIQISETSGGLQMYGSGFTSIGAPRAGAQFHFMVARFDGAASALRVDGEDETLANANPGNVGMGGILLGQKQDLQPPSAPLEIAEVLVYGRVLDASEVEALELYFRARWGI